MVPPKAAVASTHFAPGDLREFSELAGEMIRPAFSTAMTVHSASHRA